MSDTPLLRAALDYGKAGMATFPVLPLRKRPGVNDWEHAASADPRQIRRLWAPYGWANIGLPCGRNGLLVVDVDCKSGAPGVRTWNTLTRDHKIPTSTAWSRTPSGGYHIYYLLPKDCNLRNTCGKLGPGIDTRAWGGYVVVPPSKLLEGGRYVWGGKKRKPILLPDALRELLEADDRKPPEQREPPEVGDVSRYVERALLAEVERVASARQGSRNHTLNAAAFSLGTLAGASWAGLETGQVEYALLGAASACGLPGWEAQRTIASGLQAGMQHPRAAPSGG